MATKSGVVSPNAWGDPRAAIATKAKASGTAPRQASPVPGKPPTPAAPMRQRYKMAGGK